MGVQQILKTTQLYCNSLLAKLRQFWLEKINLPNEDWTAAMQLAATKELDTLLWNNNILLWFKPNVFLQSHSKKKNVKC